MQRCQQFDVPCEELWGEGRQACQDMAGADTYSEYLSDCMILFYTILYNLQHIDIAIEPWLSPSQPGQDVQIYETVSRHAEFPKAA